METTPFSTPIGETLLLEADAQVQFSREMTAMFAGGPTQLTTGRVYLTDRRFAFRPLSSYPHPQVLDLKLERVQRVQARSRKLLGFLPAGTELCLQAALYSRVFDVVVRVEGCAEWAARIDAARQSLSAEPMPSDVLDAALAQALEAEAPPDRDAYVDTLAALSFPQGYWHPEALDELEPLLEDVLQQLGVELPGDFLPGLMSELDVALKGEPVSYEEEDEFAERLEQIEICMRQVNQVLDAQQPPPPKRFYCFQEDLPGWEADEPIWLYLSAEQAERLVAAQVLTPKA